MTKYLSAGLTLTALISLATCAIADETFNLAWSGASFENSAQAVGTITMDPTQILPSGYTDNSGLFFGQTPFVSALSITVTGSGAGDGTFTLADFDTVLFDQAGGGLDFTSQLVGQATPGGPWGTPSGGAGDFNLFNRTNPGQPNAPDGTFNFTLSTDDGVGDEMLLTSFAPQAPTGTPEPGALALLGGLAISGAGFLRRRRMAK